MIGIQLPLLVLLLIGVARAQYDTNVDYPTVTDVGVTQHNEGQPDPPMYPEVPVNQPAYPDYQVIQSVAITTMATEPPTTTTRRVMPVMSPRTVRPNVRASKSPIINWYIVRDKEPFLQRYPQRSLYAETPLPWNTYNDFIDFSSNYFGSNRNSNYGYQGGWPYGNYGSWSNYYNRQPVLQPFNSQNNQMMDQDTIEYWWYW